MPAIGSKCLPPVSINAICLIDNTIPTPTTDLSFVSESGTGTLAGIAEFDSPSTPPKKYRKNTWSGTVFARAGSGCASLIETRTWEGVWSINKDTLIATESRCARYDGGACQIPPDPFSVPGSNSFFPWQTANNNTGQCSGHDIIYNFATKTTGGYNGADICQPCSPSQKYTGQGLAVLTDEDTDEDAILRAAVTQGTSSLAFRELRGVGDFSFDFCVVTNNFNCANLLEGLEYTLDYDIIVADIGGANPVTTHYTQKFTATDITEVISILSVALAGKQQTFANATISV